MGFGAGGGGSSSIATSTDVALNNPSNNQVLTYDGSVGKWKNATASGGGGGSNGPITISAVSGATYTLVLGDAETEIRFTNSSGATVTIPTNASVAFPIGTTVILHQGAAGPVTVTGAGGVTLNGANGATTTGGQFSSGVLVQTQTDVWNFVTSGASPEVVNTVASSGSSETLLANQLNYLILDANCTLTAPAAGVGQWFVLALQQDSTGSRTVTWFGGIKWPNGTVPTLTTTGAKADWFSFVCLDGTNWWGTVQGQRL